MTGLFCVMYFSVLVIRISLAFPLLLLSNIKNRNQNEKINHSIHTVDCSHKNIC